MKKFFLFDTPLSGRAVEWVALFIRVFVGVLMLSHAWPKVEGWPALSRAFPDPLGVGSQLSLAMVIFAEGICSLAIIIGLFTRLAVLPLLFNFVVIVFVVHGGMAFSDRELPVLYLGLYLIVLALGSGRFSVDRYLFKEYYPRS